MDASASGLGEGRPTHGGVVLGMVAQMIKKSCEKSRKSEIK